MRYAEWTPPRNIFGGNSKRGSAKATKSSLKIQHPSGGPGVLTGGVLFGFGDRCYCLLCMSVNDSICGQVAETAVQSYYTPDRAQEPGAFPEHVPDDYDAAR